MVDNFWVSVMWRRLELGAHNGLEFAARSRIIVILEFDDSDGLGWLGLTNLILEKSVEIQCDFLKLI